jgi:hypothetical protein
MNCRRLLDKSRSISRDNFQEIASKFDLVAKVKKKKARYSKTGICVITLRNQRGRVCVCVAASLAQQVAC